MPEQFNIKLADKVIGIHPLYSKIQDMCKDYRTDQKAEFIIETSLQDIAEEQIQHDKEAKIEGIPTKKQEDSYLETLALYRKIAEYLIDDNVILFHGSVIAANGIGYMFTAKSGTGKSTHARLWRKLLGSSAVMVNDDKPLLRISENGVFAYGTPWSGKHHLNTNICVPLKAICILSQSKENHIEPISKSTVLPMLLQQSYRPKEKDKMLKALSLINQLENSVKFYKMECNMELEAAEISYQTMSR